MGKRRSGRVTNISKSTSGRVVSNNANRRLIRDYSIPRLTPLIAIEDRRTFHPEQAARPARSFLSAKHRLVASSTPAARREFKPPVGVSFHAPERVLICVRRERRRQVIFALGKAGGGGAKRRHVKRNYYSEIGC